MKQYSLAAAVVTALFALGTAAGTAQAKKEELTAGQKAEIQTRVERLKAERAKADAAKPTGVSAPAKKPAAPKQTSRAKPLAKPVAKRTA